MYLLKATHQTIIKKYPSIDGDYISDEDKFNFGPSDEPLLVRWIKPVEGTSHYEFELLSPINGYYNWYAFDEHVVTEAAPKFWIKAVKNTVIKRFPLDSIQLGDEDKFDLKIGDQPLQVNWVKQVNSKYYQFELTRSRQGFYNWYVFAEHADSNAFQTVSASSR